MVTNVEVTAFDGRDVRFLKFAQVGYSRITWSGVFSVSRKLRCLSGLLLLAIATSSHADATRIVTTKHFELHSDPWVNLHHFLYQWARADRNLGDGRVRVAVPERDSLAALAAADRQPWQQALQFYRESVAELNHLDQRMLQQKIDLMKLGGDTNAMPTGQIDGIVDALRRAMPVYLEYWWSGHDSANRGWLTAILTQLTAHEQHFVELTARVYGSQWPASPRRVDISAYANFRAGYTAVGHTVIYSTDPGNQDLYGLETLLHEVQHTRDIGGPARNNLKAVFESAGQEVPENLWHSIIFVTAGWFAESVALQEGMAPHEAYWARESFAGFAGWQSPIEAVVSHWVPVLANEKSTAEAYASMLRYFADK